MARWENIEGVASYLSMNPGTLRNQVGRGEGVGKLFVKVGRLRRADLDDIDAFLKGQGAEE